MHAGDYDAFKARCTEKVNLCHNRTWIDGYFGGIERSLASARLAVLEEVGFLFGLMSGGRTRGRRPDRMAEAYPELQEFVRREK